MKIRSAEMHFTCPRSEFIDGAFVARRAARHGVEVPREISETHKIRAVVNHGRWIVPCPCGNAELAWRHDRVHLCTNCWNQYAGNKQIRVIWPRNYARIESILEQRPFPKNRNWIPGETLKELRKENTDHDLESAA